MYSPNMTNESTEDYCSKIKRASGLIQCADDILVGVGSGTTAAGGLCYSDPSLVEKWYPEYWNLGKRSIFEIMRDFWPTEITERNATSFWGFWSRHIYHIRYEAAVLQPYSDLFRLLENKRYFVVSTNVDGQLEKAGFDKNRIFAPQGDYALFQCAEPCSQDVYNNKNLIYTMFANMKNPFEIHASDIPRCPRCGGLLIPNLRCDFSFVESPHIQNMEQYEKFLTETYESNLVLLELGVGFNTPGIIRFPFEAIASQFPKSTLIRVNRDDATVGELISNKAISIQEDVKNALCSILERK